MSKRVRAPGLVLQHPSDEKLSSETLDNDVPFLIESSGNKRIKVTAPVQFENAVTFGSTVGPATGTSSYWNVPAPAGAADDNKVLTYDHGTTSIGWETTASGGALTVPSGTTSNDQRWNVQVVTDHYDSTSTLEYNKDELNQIEIDWVFDEQTPSLKEAYDITGASTVTGATADVYYIFPTTNGDGEQLGLKVSVASATSFDYIYVDAPGVGYRINDELYIAANELGTGSSAVTVTLTPSCFTQPPGSLTTGYNLANHVIYNSHTGAGSGGGAVPGTVTSRDATTSVSMTIGWTGSNLTTVQINGTTPPYFMPGDYVTFQEGGDDIIAMIPLDAFASSINQKFFTKQIIRRIAGHDPCHIALMQDSRLSKGSPSSFTGISASIASYYPYEYALSVGLDIDSFLYAKKGFPDQNFFNMYLGYQNFTKYKAVLHVLGWMPLHYGASHTEHGSSSLSVAGTAHTLKPETTGTNTTLKYMGRVMTNTFPRGVLKLRLDFMKRHDPPYSLHSNSLDDFYCTSITGVGPWHSNVAWWHITDIVSSSSNRADWFTKCGQMASIPKSITFTSFGGNNSRVFTPTLSNSPGVPISYKNISVTSISLGSDGSIHGPFKVSNSSGTNLGFRAFIITSTGGTSIDKIWPAWWESPDAIPESSWVAPGTTLKITQADFESEPTIYNLMHCTTPIGGLTGDISFDVGMVADPQSSSTAIPTDCHFDNSKTNAYNLANNTHPNAFDDFLANSGTNGYIPGLKLIRDGGGFACVYISSGWYVEQHPTFKTSWEYTMSYPWKVGADANPRRNLRAICALVDKFCDGSWYPDTTPAVNGFYFDEYATDKTNPDYLYARRMHYTKDLNVKYQDMIAAGKMRWATKLSTLGNPFSVPQSGTNGLYTGVPVQTISGDGSGQTVQVLIESGQVSTIIGETPDFTSETLRPLYRNGDALRIASTAQGYKNGVLSSLGLSGDQDFTAFIGYPEGKLPIRSGAAITSGSAASGTATNLATTNETNPSATGLTVDVSWKYETNLFGGGGGVVHRYVYDVHVNNPGNLLYNTGDIISVDATVFETASGMEINSRAGMVNPAEPLRFTCQVGTTFDDTQDYYKQLYAYIKAKGNHPVTGKPYFVMCNAGGLFKDVTVANDNALLWDNCLMREGSDLDERVDRGRFEESTSGPRNAMHWTQFRSDVVPPEKKSYFFDGLNVNTGRVAREVIDRYTNNGDGKGVGYVYYTYDGTSSNPNPTTGWNFWINKIKLNRGLIASEPA